MPAQHRLCDGLQIAVTRREYSVYCGIEGPRIAQRTTRPLPMMLQADRTSMVHRQCENTGGQARAT
jgi:hypothetical protein